MRNITLYLPLLLLVLISACSDSDVFTNPDDTVTTNTAADNTTTDVPGPDDYDLSQYFFHANTRAVGGEIAFTENYYEKTTGNELAYNRAIRHLNTGTNIESIRSDNVVFIQYTITVNSIKEIGVSYIGARSARRYVEVGDKYLDAINEDLGRRDTCTLQNHVDEFDLGNATESATIASGVYEDVLHVFCNRVLDLEDGDTRTNYSWNAYYAKDVGLIFADGNWIILDADNNWFDIGDTYLIPEY